MGGIGAAVGQGVKLHLTEVAGEMLTRVARKVAPAIYDKLPYGVPRLIVGLAGMPLLGLLRVPQSWRQTFAAVQIAQSLYGFTTGIRSRLYEGVGLNGLGDYVTTLNAGDDDDDGKLADDYGMLGLGWQPEPDDSGAINDFVTTDYV